MTCIRALDGRHAAGAVSPAMRAEATAPPPASVSITGAGRESGEERRASRTAVLSPAFDACQGLSERSR